MLGAVIYLVLGAALTLLGFLGKRFYAGLSARVPIPVWQGRVWLLGLGGLIALMGLSGVVANSHSKLHHSVELAFLRFNIGYELFGGILAALVGLIFLLARKDKVDIAGRLLGAGGIFLGLVLISDAILKIRM